MPTNYCPQGTSSQKVDSATQVSTEFVYNSPEKKRLRHQLLYEQQENAKKMKVAYQIIRRQNGRSMGQLFDRLLKKSQRRASFEGISSRIANIRAYTSLLFPTCI